jgi:hypothetical protein
MPIRGSLSLCTVREFVWPVYGPKTHGIGFMPDRISSIDVSRHFGRLQRILGPRSFDEPFYLEAFLLLTYAER